MAEEFDWMNDPENLPKIHPRQKITDRARVELGRLLIDWRSDSDLTRAEEFEILADKLRSLAQSLVIEERRVPSPHQVAIKVVDA